MIDPVDKKIGLVLTGGGARAAYQVGVLRAIAKITGFKTNPFRIISGYSAGAINGAWLAGRGEDFNSVTEGMWNEWASIKTEDIFDVEAPGMIKIGLRWIKDRALGGMQNPDSQIVHLLDTAPLRRFVENKICFEGIRRNVASGQLLGLAITAVNYHTGQSITFFDGHANVNEWNKLNRLSQRAVLTADHVLGSSAIPIFFSPVKINNAFFGDGMVRLNAPLSPAIHMGAERLMVIGIRGPSSTSAPDNQPHASITLGEIAGTVLNGLFFDALDADLERMERINRSVGWISTEERARHPEILRQIPVLHLRPSQEVGDVPTTELDRLPGMLRYAFKGLGLNDGKGSDLLSYLAFESRYVGTLLELGYADTLKQQAEIETFFS